MRARGDSVATDSTKQLALLAEQLSTTDQMHVQTMQDLLKSSLKTPGIIINNNNNNNNNNFSLCIATLTAKNVNGSALKSQTVKNSDLKTI